MTWVRWSMLVYGAFLITMGVQSYFFPREGHEPSMMSLAAAAGMGIVALVLTYLATILPNPRGVYITMIFLSVFAMSRFLMVGITKGNWVLYPNLTVIAASLVMIGILGAGHMMKVRQNKSSADAPGA
ncbi:MAG: hypothetical protein LCH41_07010 [Armatimonadetes bacterium]|nr:hypothetical protein [Armatimonadota bacterium]